MQFAKVQGSGLAALGLLLLALQGYILFSSTRPSGSPTQAPATPTQGEQITKFVPGIVGLTGSGCWRVFSPSSKETGEQRRDSAREDQVRLSKVIECSNRTTRGGIGRLGRRAETCLAGVRFSRRNLDFGG
jgi:hypothetical protein